MYSIALGAVIDPASVRRQICARLSRVRPGNTKPRGTKKPKHWARYIPCLLFAASGAFLGFSECRPILRRGSEDLIRDHPRRHWSLTKRDYCDHLRLSICRYPRLLPGKDHVDLSTVVSLSGSCHNAQSPSSIPNGDKPERHIKHNGADSVCQMQQL